MNLPSLSLRSRSLVLHLAWLAAGAAAAVSLPAAETFRPTPDHLVRPDVPAGKLVAMPPWTSRLFAPTVRDWWVYVPAGYKPDGTAALMVFQDGHDYVNPKGNWRVPTVFDNLIAAGAMPVTLAVFMNPGHDPAKPAPKSAWQASNRSLEYNSLGDRYARFLLEELLPEVAKTYPFSDDPERRAIAGASSGGIAAFTVAWERPDRFRKVLSTIGSFVHLAGGHDYPALIRKTERRPLRVFLEDAAGDLDNPYGNWPLANRQMHAALKYMGYDVKFEYADGFAHNSVHGGMVLPDALRWLWRAEKPVAEIDIRGDLGGDLTLHKLLIPGEDWTPVAEGLGFADALAADGDGNLWFSDLRGAGAGVYRISGDGTRTKFSPEAASGLKFGPDGRIYACQGAKQRLIALGAADGAISVLAEGVRPNDLVVTGAGHIYFTETAAKQVTWLDPKTGARRAADTGLAGPNGIALSPDGGTLAVSEHAGGHVWTFRVNPDGALDAKMPTMTLRRPIDPAGTFRFHEPPPYRAAARGDGMATDALGRYFVTTALGVQVFDPTGRACGLLALPPTDKGLTSCVLAGPARDYLYVAAGDRIFRRKVQVTAAR